MWLTRLALRNPVLILMMSLMTLALGFVSLRHLSVDLFPDITVPLIRVAIFYTGAGPTDIEKSITMPVERAVSASPGVRSEEHTSELQSPDQLVCRLLLVKKKGEAPDVLNALRRHLDA